MTRVKNWPIINLWPRWLLAFSLLSGPALAAEPLRLAERAEYYEQVYLSEAQALQQAFGEMQVSKRLLKPTVAQRTRIQKRLRRKLDQAELNLYIGSAEGKPQRYAFVLHEKGKHYPITFLVALSPDARVKQVAVMVYRERRGDGVKRQRFLQQFLNKGAKDPLEVNTDIVHITGSTISSWSLAAGVRKAIVLLEELVLRP